MLNKLSLALMMLGLSFPFSASAQAAEVEVIVEIPRLNVSEYHRPYVAVWVQDENRKVSANLAVWYQLDSAGGEVGTKWLPDLRQWWRRTGRGLELPVDGVSGATRPAGTHQLTFSQTDKQLSNLNPGKYTLVVEAAREVGGRELLEIPFTWPVEKTFKEEVRGKEELGKVGLTIKP